MRYLYQQLLAFCGMVALILLIVGVSFTQLTKQTIEENNYQQLFGYAESVEKTTQTYADTLPQFTTYLQQVDMIHLPSGYLEY